MIATDVGAAKERTALAWQRTALALIVGSALLTRLAEERIGWFALFSLCVAAPINAWILFESRDR